MTQSCRLRVLNLQWEHNSADGIEGLSSSAFGTPSTISTAPSTEAEEGSVDSTEF